jgi:hypothetical protein
MSQSLVPQLQAELLPLRQRLPSLLRYTVLVSNSESGMAIIGSILNGRMKELFGFLHEHGISSFFCNHRTRIIERCVTLGWGHWKEGVMLEVDIVFLIFLFCCFRGSYTPYLASSCFFCVCCYRAHSIIYPQKTHRERVAVLM